MKVFPLLDEHLFQQKYERNFRLIQRWKGAGMVAQRAV